MTAPTKGATWAERVARELQADGTLLPPWKRYPEIPGGSIGWRMGPGEEYLDLWWHWSRQRTRHQLLDYFRSHTPLPVEWVYWAAGRLDDRDPIETAEDDIEQSVARLAGEGLCDLHAWQVYWRSDDA